MLVEEWNPFLIRPITRDKLTGPLDRRLLALGIHHLARARTVWDLVPGVPDDHLTLTLGDQEIGVEKVLDRLHAPVLVGLLLDHDRLGLQDPRLLLEMPDHTREDAVRVERWDPRDIPLMNLFRRRMN